MTFWSFLQRWHKPHLPYSNRETGIRKCGCLSFATLPPTTGWPTAVATVMETINRTWLAPEVQRNANVPGILRAPNQLCSMWWTSNPRATGKATVLIKELKENLLFSLVCFLYLFHSFCEAGGGVIISWFISSWGCLSYSHTLSIGFCTCNISYDSLNSNVYMLHQRLQSLRQYTA